MASRNLARGGSQEHESAQTRLEEARESRDIVEDRRDAAMRSGVGELDAAMAVQAAEDQVAARKAWVEWVARDY